MTEVIQFAVLGLGLAAVYALLAQGLVAIYRGSGVVNFAHGAFALVGAAVFTELDRRGWPAGAALAAAAVVGGVLGAVAAPWVIDRVPTGLLTVITAWLWVPLLVPLAWMNQPAVVGAALFLGLLLNPAGNAASSSYGMTLIPAGLQGRVSSATRFCSMSVMPLAPLAGAALLTWVGGSATVLVLAAFTGLVALIPTLSTVVRSVPRPADWSTARSAEVVEDREGAAPRV